MRGAFLKNLDEGSLFDLEKKRKDRMRGAFLKFSTGNRLFPSESPGTYYFFCRLRKKRHVSNEGSLFDFEKKKQRPTPDEGSLFDLEKKKERQDEGSLFDFKKKKDVWNKS